MFRSTMLRLTSSSFFKSISSMMLLVGLGQLANILTAPILTRIYTPEAMGQYGLLLTYIMMAAAFTTLFMETAIPAATSQQEAEELTVWAAWLAAGNSIALSVVLGGLIAFDVSGFGSMPLGVCFLTALVLWLQSFIQMDQAWLVRMNQTNPIGYSGLQLNVGRALAQVIGGFTPFGWIALVVGEAAGRLPPLIYLHHRLKASAVRIAVWQQWPNGATFWKFRRFPFVMIPATAVDAVVNLIQMALLTGAFGVSGLGQYFLVRRVVDLPIAFVVRSLADVLYARMAQLSQTAPERMRRFVALTSGCLLVGGLAVGLPMAFVAEPVFVFVFGQEWRTAGVMAPLLAVPAALNLAVAPVSRVFLLSRKAPLRFLFSVFNALGLVALWVAIEVYQASLIEAVAVIAVSTAVCYIIYGLAAVYASGTDEVRALSRRDIGPG